MEPFHKELQGNVQAFAQLDSLTNRFIKNLRKVDRKKEFEHTMVNLSLDAKQERTELQHKEGYPLIVIKNSLRIFHDPLELSLPLIRFIRQAEGIVHVHGISSFVYDSIAPFLASKPSIAHHRGGHFTWKAFPVSCPKYIVLAPFTLRAPKKLFIQNKARIEKYRRNYRIPMEKMVHVPNGVELEKFQADPVRIDQWRKKLQINNEIVVFFVGRLEKGKGILELLSAVKQLQAKHKVKLIIAGSGSLEKQLYAQGNPGITVLGRINDIRDMAALHHVSDIFALPSYSEGFPNTVMEAMACGKAVITTPTDGALDLVDHEKTGLLVPSRNVQALAQGLEQLISDESLRLALGKSAKQKIQQHFTWSKIAPRIFDEYRKLTVPSK